MLLEDIIKLHLILVLLFRYACCFFLRLFVRSNKWKSEELVVIKKKLDVWSCLEFINIPFSVFAFGFKKKRTNKNFLIGFLLIYDLIYFFWKLSRIKKATSWKCFQYKSLKVLLPFLSCFVWFRCIKSVSVVYKRKYCLKLSDTYLFMSVYKSH